MCMCMCMYMYMYMYSIKNFTIAQFFKNQVKVLPTIISFTGIRWVLVAQYYMYSFMVNQGLRGT